MVLMFAAVHYTIQYMGMIQSVCKVYMVQCNSASSCTIHNNVSNACMYKSICIRPPVCTLYPPLYSIKCMQVICTSTVCIKRLYIAMNAHYRYVQRLYVMVVYSICTRHILYILSDHICIQATSSPILHA